MRTPYGLSPSKKLKHKSISSDFFHEEKNRPPPGVGGCFEKLTDLRANPRISDGLKDSAIFSEGLKDLEHFEAFYKGKILLFDAQYSKFSPAARYDK